MQRLARHSLARTRGAWAHVCKGHARVLYAETCRAQILQGRVQLVHVRRRGMLCLTKTTHTDGWLGRRGRKVQAMSLKYHFTCIHTRHYDRFSAAYTPSINRPTKGPRGVPSRIKIARKMHFIKIADLAVPLQGVKSYDCCSPGETLARPAMLHIRR